MDNSNLQDAAIGFFSGALIGTALLTIVGLPMYLLPKYHVYSQRQTGMAELARADFNRQVLVRTAQAQEEAAKFTAQADIIRAQGVAQANQIIGKSLENNKDYLTWKFIDELPQNQNQIIYLPSSGQLPFTEATRLHNNLKVPEHKQE